MFHVFFVGFPSSKLKKLNIFSNYKCKYFNFFQHKGACNCTLPLLDSQFTNPAYYTKFVNLYYINYIFPPLLQKYHNVESQCEVSPSELVLFDTVTVARVLFSFLFCFEYLFFLLCIVFYCSLTFREHTNTLKTATTTTTIHRNLNKRNRSKKVKKKHFF